MKEVPKKGERVWKHPHGCGEDKTKGAKMDIKRETPPRVWGRSARRWHRAFQPGNTPTGVGKIDRSSGERILHRKHPHGCGEDAGKADDGRPHPETPPRVWGRFMKCRKIRHFFGNTPTGVGKIEQVERCALTVWKHPHGCGEDSMKSALCAFSVETPPRVWGR